METYRIEEENRCLQEEHMEFFLQNNPRLGPFLASHLHPAVEILYVIGGIYRMGVDNATFEAGPGDLVLFRSGTVHRSELLSGAPGQYYVLKVHPSLLFDTFTGHHRDCVLAFLQNRPDSRSLFPAAELAPAVREPMEKLIREEQERDPLRRVAQRIHACELLLGLLRTALPPVGSSSERENLSESAVQKIYDGARFIEENYASDITPAECAAALHMSYSYFARLFRAVTGKTFKEYLTSVRLSRAENLLNTTDRSVTEIAALCGYSNLAYFIAEYRRSRGHTPGSVRRRGESEA